MLVAPPGPAAVIVAGSMTGAPDPVDAVATGPMSKASDEFSPNAIVLDLVWENVFFRTPDRKTQPGVLKKGGALKHALFASKHAVF